VTLPNPATPPHVNGRPSNGATPGKANESIADPRRYVSSSRHKAQADTASRSSGSARRPGRPSPDLELRIHLARLCDGIVAVGALLGVFVVTNLGRMPDGLRDFLAMRVTVKNLLYLAAFIAAWRLVSWLTGLYDWRHLTSRRSELLRLALTCTLISGAALTFPVLSISGAFRYSTIFLFWLTATATMLVLRTVVRTVTAVPETGTRRDTIIVGTGPLAIRLLTELRDKRPGQYNVVGFVDSDDHRPAASTPDALLGTLDDIEAVFMRHAIDEVFIALPIKSRYADIQRVIETCERVGVRARYMADLFGASRGWVGEVEDQQVSLVSVPSAPSGWRFVAKRMTDLVGASVALVLVAPVLVASAVAIKLTSRGTVLFVQHRYGLNRRVFKMYKLRTMVADAEQLQAALEDQNEASGPVFKIRADPRITPVGRFLRRTSIDELPQLVNVLRGEMSLVGPRPLPARDVHRFTEAALMRRFSVRPGLTCLWQISGRSDLGFQEWVRLDLQYIDEWSLPLDLKILLLTVPVVVRGSGAS
jgi:exopolysaccharide biosynthesis polyprenyl glycosylphosphotransferase